MTVRMLRRYTQNAPAAQLPILPNCPNVRAGLGLRPLMSFMTSAEIEFGVIRRNWGQESRQRLEQYLSQYYSVIHSNDALCRVWAHLKAESKLAGKILPESDAWNAGLAVLLDVPLLSHNRKHYEHLSQLKLISMPD